MKTNSIISKTVKAGFTALFLFTIPSVALVNASDNGNSSAFDRIEKMSMNIEQSLRYVAPESPESADEFYTANEGSNDAYLRLENEAAAVEECIKYKAPEESEDIKAYELELAMSRLDNYFLAVEDSIKL
jgi:hypothetical protein